ncbi:MAG TPA: hypothetical protein VN702_08710 [Acetobacteraceae bacterium]|nr:hypothetical protein [Acetobacteraceae bacterium]
MAAISNGATLEEILETLELASVTGIQSMMVGISILDEEMAGADRRRTEPATT